MLCDALVGHMREAVALPEPGRCGSPSAAPDCDPEEYETVASSLDNILPRPALGSPFRVHVTGLVYNRRSGAPETGDPAVASELGRYLREKIYHHRDAIARVEEFEMEDAEVAIFAYGSVARSAKAVVRWARGPGRARRLGAADHPLAVPHAGRRAYGRAGAHRDRARDEPEADGWEVRAAVAGRARIVDYGRVDGRLITPEEIHGLVEAEFQAGSPPRTRLGGT